SAESQYDFQIYFCKRRYFSGLSEKLQPLCKLLQRHLSARRSFYGRNHHSFCNFDAEVNIKINSMQNIKLLIIFILFSSSGYSQSVTPVQINGELFELPGKWEFVTQLKESGQYHFSNKKKDLGIMISVRIASNF